MFGSPPRRRARTRRATSPGFGYRNRRRGDHRGQPSLMEMSRLALLAARRRTQRKFAANAIEANRQQRLLSKRKKSWL
jgi:hypothetical protein